MIKLWNKDPKKELSKKLTKLAEKHREISDNKNRERCEGFLKELYETFTYTIEKFGERNEVFTWLNFYCAVCQKALGGNVKSVSLHQRKRTSLLEMRCCLIWYTDENDELFIQSTQNSSYILQNNRTSLYILSWQMVCSCHTNNMFSYDNQLFK